MNKTVIFISGWAVPNWLAKSKFVWDESLWSRYHCIWIESQSPTSDSMVHHELNRLEYLIDTHPGCAVVGQSLGGWWAANLALRPHVALKKVALWTPLCDASAYPIFKVSRKYHPTKQRPYWNQGPHRVLTLTAKRDLIVPSDAHGYELSKHFMSMNYDLDGGHIFQRNHKTALNYMKDWIETQ